MSRQAIYRALVVSAALLAGVASAAAPTAAPSPQQGSAAGARATAQPSAHALEYRVKAAFLYNFARFVRWPPGAEPAPSQPFCLGILGSDPFGELLEETIAGKQVDGHDLEVRRAQRIDDLGGCQLVFIHGLEAADLDSVLSRLADLGSLTVGESDGFAERGGMVGFVLQDDRVRFEINPAAAERAGLEISSKLLRLAKVVEPSASG